MITRKREDKSTDISRYNKVRKIVAPFLALIILIMLPVILPSVYDKLSYTNSISSVVAWIMLSFALGGYSINVDNNDRREWVICGTFSLLFAIFHSIGYQLERYNAINLRHPRLWLSIVVTTVIATIALRYIIAGISMISDKLYRHDMLSNNAKNNLYFPNKMWIIWLILLLCWFIVFLSLYPGAFTYDATYEYVEVASRQFDTHHPLIHVLVMGGAVRFGEVYLHSANLGIAIYTLFQMLIMSLCFAYSIIYMLNKGVNKIYRWISLVYIAIFPVIPLYAVAGTKDGLFAVMVMMASLTFWEILTQKDDSSIGAKKSALLVVTSILMMLLRNNGIYAYCLLLLVVLCHILVGKLKGNIEYRLLRVTWLMIGSIIGTIVVNVILIIGLDASAGGRQEMLTVPIQQLARVYNYSKEAYDDEELELLLDILPSKYLEQYNNRVSDNVKLGFNNETYKTKKKEFINLWVKVGLRKPMTYINAWALTSYGNWYSDAIINVYKGNVMNSFVYEDSSYFGFATDEPGLRDSKIPILEEFYRKISLEIYQQKVPVISMMFSPGFMFWIYMLLTLIVIIKRKYNNLWFVLLPLFVWCTVIFGPTYLVRYVLVLWTNTHIAIVTILYNIDEHKHKRNIIIT